MEQNRIKLHELYKKASSDTGKYFFYQGKKIEHIDDFLDSFKTEVGAKGIFKYFQTIGRPLYKSGFERTTSSYLTDYCCDLQWAKDAGYCGTSNQQNNQQNNQQQNNGGSSSYSSCNISSSDIENGTSVSKGVKCSIVGDIQRALQKHCYSLRDDNMFGPVTEGKIKDFQRSNGISPANGVVDGETWEELQKSPSSPCPSGRSGGGRRKSKSYEQDGGEEDVQIIDL